MPPRIQIISILICIFLVAYVFELVRRKHLSEEYSMGWLITGASMLALSVSEGLLKWVSEIVGATLFTSTLFFFGLLFLMVICLHFSIRISALTNQVRKLTQSIGILDLEKKTLERQIKHPNWRSESSNMEQFWRFYVLSKVFCHIFVGRLIRHFKYQTDWKNMEFFLPSTPHTQMYPPSFPNRNNSIKSLSTASLRN